MSTQRTGEESTSTPPANQQGQETQQAQQPAEVTFSPDQSTKVSEIAARERNQGRAAGKREADESLNTKLKEAGFASLDELIEKASKPPAEAPKDEAKDQENRLTEKLAQRDSEWRPKLDAANQKLDEARKEIEQLKTQYRNERKWAALVDAAAKAKAIKPEAVAKLLVEQVDFDEHGSLIVAGKAGPRLGKNGDPMTPDELVAEFVTDNPWLAQPSGTQGGGSGPNAQGPIDPKQKALQDKNPTAYLGAALASALKRKE